MRLKYTVRVGYMYFDFSGGTEALQFAKMAALTRRNEDDDVEINVGYPSAEKAAVNVKAFAETPEAALTAMEQREADRLFADEV